MTPQTPTAMITKNTVLWYVTPCNLTEIRRNLPNFY